MITNVTLIKKEHIDKFWVAFVPFIERETQNIGMKPFVQHTSAES